MASILDLVGNTPLVELTKITPNPKVKIYAKLELNLTKQYIFMAI